MSALSFWCVSVRLLNERTGQKVGGGQTHLPCWKFIDGGLLFRVLGHRKQITPRQARYDQWRKAKARSSFRQEGRGDRIIYNCRIRQLARRADCDGKYGSVLASRLQRA